MHLDDGRLFVMLGDASGHGIGPALSATQLAGMLRVALRLGAGLDAIFAQVNNQLVEDLPDEHFVTAFVGLLDRRQHCVEFHSAGQGPLLHYQAAEHLPLAAADHVPARVRALPALDPPQRLDLAPATSLA